MYLPRCTSGLVESPLADQPLSQVIVGKVHAAAETERRHRVYAYTIYVFLVGCYFES